MTEYKPLSEVIKKLIFRFLKTNKCFQLGFLQSNYRVVLKAHLDEDECTKILEQLVINKVNVIRYLGHKYIPTWVENGALFKDQKCIQKVIIKEDKSLVIFINNSEPHKIITDTIHVLRLLDSQNLEYNNEIKFIIEALKVANQDLPLYGEFLKDNGLPIPYHIRETNKKILTKFKTLEDVASCKKRSIKRKFLRYRVKLGEINWKQLRTIINITDFSKANIKDVCDKIRSGEIQ